MHAYLRGVIRAVIAVLAGLMLSVGPAKAAIYVGAWDPPYGFPFTATDPFGMDLGWRGEVQIFISSTCTPVDNSFFNVGLNGCGGSKLVGAFVELYDEGAGANPPTIATLTFDVNSFALAQLRFTGVGGTLAGFTTDQSDYVIDPGAGTNALWALQFVKSPYEGPQLAWYKDPCPATGPCSGTNSFARDNLPVLRITQVPEPGGLALIAGAILAAGWGTRIRRHRFRAAAGY